MTQPVFDVGELRARSSSAIDGVRIAGASPAIVPFESLRHAEFMANEVPGVRVPDALVERMRRADGAGARGGRRDSRLHGRSRPRFGRCVQGVQISTAVRAIDRGGAGESSMDCR